MTSLLMAMGAASLAYVPLRPAVIAEGGTELVLLATLMREAIQREDIGFAVVPGSSSTPPERIAGLDLQGVRTLWVPDSDEAGRKRRGELIDTGIPVERIVMLSDDGDLEIEDLIDAQTYCAAVNLYVADMSFGESFGAEARASVPSSSRLSRADAMR
jgi:predicted ATP-dependent endonuclease of OLD family